MSNNDEHFSRDDIGTLDASYEHAVGITRADTPELIPDSLVGSSSAAALDSSSSSAAAEKKSGAQDQDGPELFLENPYSSATRRDGKQSKKNGLPKNVAEKRASKNPHGPELFPDERPASLISSNRTTKKGGTSETKEGTTDAHLKEQAMTMGTPELIPDDYPRYSRSNTTARAATMPVVEGKKKNKKKEKEDEQHSVVRSTIPSSSSRIETTNGDEQSIRTTTDIATNHRIIGAIRVGGIDGQNDDDHDDLHTEYDNYGSSRPPPQEIAPAVITSARVVVNVDDEELAQNKNQLNRMRQMFRGAGHAEALVVDSDDGKKQTRKGYLFIGIGVCILLAIIVGVVVGVVVSQDSGGGNKDAENDGSNVDSSPTPVGVPSVAPSLARFELFRAIAEPISGSIVLSDETSPQFQALDWIANQDLAMLDPDQDRDEIGVRYVLAVLYYSTSGPTWKNQRDFLSFASVCTWNSADTLGVYCNDEGIVDDIDISFDLFRGTMPAELGHLTNLVELRFFSHKSSSPSQSLTGRVPTELGLLEKLTFLDFRQNRLTGTIPSELGLLSNMRRMSLAENDFTGTVPIELAYLPNLEDLSLYFLDGVTGTLNPGFCERSVPFEKFWSDCPVIPCDCCTYCCGGDRCQANE